MKRGTVQCTFRLVWAFHASGNLSQPERNGCWNSLHHVVFRCKTVQWKGEQLSPASFCRNYIRAQLCEVS